MIKILFFIVLLLNTSFCLAADIPSIAVASNMSHVLKEISTQFKLKTGSSVNLSVGSSGNFTRQILQGAPYELFISANKKYVNIRRKKGMSIEASSELARGRIGMFIPNNSPLYHSTDLDDVMKSLYHGQYRRMAIANPEHAPYGQAAKQALQYAGLWIIERDKLLVGENAAQAMQFTLSGSVDLGIVPSSFIYLPKIKNKGLFLLIPESWHQPIIQYLTLFKGAGDISKSFYAYLLTDDSKNIIKKYGYAVE